MVIIFFSNSKDDFSSLIYSHGALQQWPLYQLDEKMPFLMGICRKEFIWSNLLAFLFKGSLLDWYVVSANPYMVLRSLLAWFEKFSKVVQ